LLRQWQNSLFCHNEKAFNANILRGTSQKLAAPDLNELKTFWQGIFEKDAEANLQSTWLRDLHNQLPSDDVSVSEEPSVGSDCFTCCIRKSRNWAAPGPDGVQGYWIKRISALHGHLLEHFRTMLSNGACVPDWLPCGGTSLIPKSLDSTAPKSYRPITCLNVLYGAAV